MVVDRYRNGRGNSIYDNITVGEMMIINDENPEAEKETCVTLMRANKNRKWFVWDVDPGFKSQDKELQAQVDDYIRQRNELELQDLS